MNDHAISDDQVRAIYQKLIGLSFEDANSFEPYQRAWHEVQVILGVIDVTNNGHGRVVWSSVPMRGATA